MQQHPSIMAVPYRIYPLMNAASCPCVLLRSVSPLPDEAGQELVNF